MKILSIETSCDETAAAIVEGRKGNAAIKLISQTIATSMEIHAKTGGIIPEHAARNQVAYILPVITKTLHDANISSTNPSIDAVAVTYGPGLIGSLLVGVETAKTLSFVWNKPLIPVNHLYGHIYANFIETPQSKNIAFPALALIVSGGHTDLVLLKKHGDVTWLGGTLDDAAGEALDKIGRVLKLTYPGGPAIEKIAEKGNEKAFRFPRALLASNNFDFSFSGLKTAVLREIKLHNALDEKLIADIAASMQKAIIDVLVKKTVSAAELYQAKTILLGGGVAANKKLIKILQEHISALELPIQLSVPPAQLCTDNAAMIGAAAFYNPVQQLWENVQANPQLYFD